jgi:hypothetical protein
MSIYMDKIKIKFSFINKFSTFKNIVILVSQFNYKLFKVELKFENYLDILEEKDTFTLCRFRTTNHRLPVEVGKWKTNY